MDWWTGETVAVVTGGNRGIGLEIVRQMASKGLTVVLTSRNQERGLAATESLLQEGLHNVLFQRLDVESSDSISQFVHWLHDKFGGLDILVNNAAVPGLEVDWELMEKQQMEMEMDMRALLDWWTGETVAVVTGGNRGIGLEIVRQMASKGLTVVLTSRNEQRGLDATQSLLQQGFRKVFFRILDVQSSDSISQFAEWLHNKFGGLDILINNAGIGETEVDWDLMKQQGKDYRTILLSSKSDRAVIFDYESTRMCIDTNYYGAKRTIKALMPLLRASSARPRIVNVSSAFGLLAMLPNQTLRTQLSDVSNVNEEFIDSVLNRFLEDVKTSTENLEEKGWPVPFSGYKMSKIALNAYTRLLAAEVGERGRVNCVHPGYVRTDMTFNTGDLSATEGAANVVRVALDPPDGPSGHIFLQKEIGCF